jgi:hypothetical protein
MMKWMTIGALVALSAPTLAQDATTSMPAHEREAYLEACLIITQTDPQMSTYQRIGTGAVTRGHATVVMYDMAKGRSAELECSFATLTEGPAPTAEKLTVTYDDSSPAEELDVAAANATIAGKMKD